jgi:pimeloyl-ACP methyl ester carboxylesterase
MAVTKRTIQTSHGDIAVSETSGAGLPVLMIHGNSSCKEVYSKQLEGELGDRFHLIAMDLPGHGQSADALEPERTYSMPGFADAAAETLEVLGIDAAAVVGWSLGGHAAVEMLPRYPGIAGLMLMATPPVNPTPESIQAGFLANPVTPLLGKPDLSDEEVGLMASAVYGPALNDMLLAALRRADGRARALMFQGLFTGKISSQRNLVEDASVPVAMVNGAADPFVNIGYIGDLRYANLWDKHCYVLRGLGHVAFLQAPDLFNPILGRFLAEIADRVVGHGRSTGSKTAAA